MNYWWEKGNWERLKFPWVLVYRMYVLVDPPYAIFCNVEPLSNEQMGIIIPSPEGEKCPGHLVGRLSTFQALLYERVPLYILTFCSHCWPILMQTQFIENMCFQRLNFHSWMPREKSPHHSYLRVKMPEPMRRRWWFWFMEVVLYELDSGLEGLFFFHLLCFFSWCTTLCSPYTLPTLDLSYNYIVFNLGFCIIASPCLTLQIYMNFFPLLPTRYI